MKNLFSSIHPLIFLIITSALILFTCSSIRHALFQSNAYDLGIFDNGIYLISQGKEPYVSFRGLHILGDHAAWILYPLALFYKIYPDVHWLFAVQAIALALGALPTWYLARQAGLQESEATTLALVYLLYPLIFNVNLFDFHPEVIALPALFWAVLAARSQRFWQFCLAVLVILAGKAVLSLTVTAMGLWLLMFEKKRLCGFVAIVVGIAWFFLATEAIIPTFSGGEAAAVNRYEFLGDSVREIAQNLFLQPGLVLSRLFTLANLEYLALLLLPLIWGLSPRHLAPLIGAIPALFLNLLTDHQAQKDLVHQYSLPILPFLLLAVIGTLAAGEGWFHRRRSILLWSLLAFLALSKYGYFGSKYLEYLDTWPAMREAVAQVPTQGSILTNTYIAPQLTHRLVVELATEGSQSQDLQQFAWVLLNQRHPGWASSPAVINTLVERLQQDPQFQLNYRQDGVFLFERTF